MEAETLAQLIGDNYRAWLEFLNTCSPGDFENIVQYKTLAGVSYGDRLADILGHVVNHGTHHRAQAGQELNFTGLEKLPDTDYISYLRS